MNSSRTGLAIAILILVGVLVACAQQYGAWAQLITVTPEEASKDYLGKVWTAFTTDPVGLMFAETEGSAPLLKFFSLGLVWIWFCHFTGYCFERRAIRGGSWKPLAVLDHIHWSNLTWSLIATAWVLVAWIWAAGVQHFGWYACYPQTIHGITYQCYPGEQGTMDATTHWLTPGALFAIIATINLMDPLGLKGRLGRGIELAIKVAVLLLIIIGFEVIESGSPGVYVNVLINSQTDMLAGLTAVGFGAGWYEAIVPYEE